jgi:hypothetical protein
LGDFKEKVVTLVQTVSGLSALVETGKLVSSKRAARVKERAFASVVVVLILVSMVCAGYQLGLELKSGLSRESSKGAHH